MGTRFLERLTFPLILVRGLATSKMDLMAFSAAVLATVSENSESTWRPSAELAAEGPVATAAESSAFSPGGEEFAVPPAREGFRRWRMVEIMSVIWSA